MTFSLTARCPETGMLGMVISSSSPAVAARCVHVRAKVGAVASQNITDPGLGQIGLDLLARGLSATEVRDALVVSTRFIAYRPGESGEGNQAAMILTRYSSSQPAVLRRRRMESFPGRFRVRL